MKTKLMQLALAAALLASPLAYAGEPEKTPGKDSTSTTAPIAAPSQPSTSATDPASSTGAVGAQTGKNQGKDSTATDVRVPSKSADDAKK